MKKIISAICILIFCVTLMIMIKNKIFLNSYANESEKSASAVNSEVATQEKQSGEKKYKSVSKGDKVLDETYLHAMNEDVYVTSSDGEEMCINVYDAYLTRDISEYQGLLEEPCYYQEEMKNHLDKSGVFIDDYYYIVTFVKIKNIGDTQGECLIPGLFSYVYIKDGVTEAQPASLVARYAVKLSGNGRINSQGHLFSEPGEIDTFALINIRSENELNRFKEEGKDCYLTTTDSEIKYIPNDENQVKFIKLDFRIEE